MVLLVTEPESLKATVQVWFPSHANAEQAFFALQPELNQAHQKRSVVQMEFNEKTLKAEILATDHTALQGSLHQLLKSIALIQSVQHSKK